MNDSIRKILEQYSEDDYEEICRRTDFWGEDSLTEDEQIVLRYWHRRFDDEESNSEGLE